MKKLISRFNIWLFLVASFCGYLTIDTVAAEYRSLGIGGGGAMTSVSISPYDDTWFVGTDMNIFWRSTDNGLTWNAIEQFELTHQSETGPNFTTYFEFNPDGVTVFYGDANAPKKSTDGGLTWHQIDSLDTLIKTRDAYILDADGNVTTETETRKIIYWLTNSTNENIIYCATANGLLRSTDKGNTWTEINNLEGRSTGTFIDYQTGHVYHGTVHGIFKSTNGGASFSLFKSVANDSFAGGRDAHGLTLAYLTNGIVKVGKDGSNQFSGNEYHDVRYLRMAENDSQTIYLTRNRYQDGHVDATAIWKSGDAGDSWIKIFEQNDTWATSHDVEYSAISADIGWWDGGYLSFAVNRRNSAIVAGSEWMFFHSSKDHGATWQAPFTQFADTGDRSQRNKKWKSVGMEPTSVNRIEFNPDNSQFAYITMADVGGSITEDGGKTFRLVIPRDAEGIPLFNGGYNSYDVAFVPGNQSTFYTAWSQAHDWPFLWYYQPLNQDIHNPDQWYNGGILKTIDGGITWTNIAPKQTISDGQSSFEGTDIFLSVAYHPSDGMVYGGTHGNGIIRGTNDTLAPFNAGLPDHSIIPQIEILSNGDIYILVTGIGDGNGIYLLHPGSTSWEKLGPKTWWYPTRFAVDQHNANTLYLTDFVDGRDEAHAEPEGPTKGVWKSTDGGQSWTQKRILPYAVFVTIDPNNASHIFAVGPMHPGEFPSEASAWYTQGGIHYSPDGGDTWSKKSDFPIKGNAMSVTINPNDTGKMFYALHGGFMLYGPNPMPDNGAPLAPKMFRIKP